MAKRRKYNINSDYFEIIDSEDKAYWLGYLMADGNISKSNKNGNYDRLTVNCSPKDIEHLSKFKKCLDYEGDIKSSHKHHNTKNFDYDISEVRINCLKMCNDLILLGVVPNKTGKESFPQLENSLKRHFVRGFFDGDGSLTKKGYFRIGSCSLKILEDISSFIKDEINEVLKIYSTDKYNYTFYTFDSGSQVRNKKIMDLLYKDSSIYLQRKYERYIEKYCSPK